MMWMMGKPQHSTTKRIRRVPSLPWNKYVLLFFPFVSKFRTVSSLSKSQLLFQFKKVKRETQSQLNNTMKRAAKSLVICSILVPSLGLPSRNGPMSTPTTIARADSYESSTKHAVSPIDTFKSNNNKSRKGRSRIRSRDYCSRMEDDDLSCHADDRDESTLSSRTSHGPLSSRLDNMLQQDRTSVVVAATTVMRKEQ